MRLHLQIVPAIILVLATSACNKKAAPSYQVVSPAPGTFELCILANPEDDEIGIKDSDAFFERAKTDPKLKKLLSERAARREPPPPPVIEGEPYIVLERECSYRWIRLSRAVIRAEQINPISDAKGRDLYENLKRARERGETYVDARHSEQGLSQRVFWSQEPPASNPGSENIDYFVLVRIESAKNAVLAEEVTITLEPTLGNDPGPHLYGSLDETGTQKFADLTTRNKPTAINKRYLAIVVGGDVITMATLNTSVSDGRFVLEGNGYEDSENIFAAIRGH